MPEEQEVFIKRCVFCPETHVITETPLLKNCPKCARHYCTEHCSKVDPQFCQDCLIDVVVKDEVIVKTDEEWDVERDVLVRHTSKYRHIEFFGVGWMFYTKAIAHLTDDELKAFIEYHKAVISIMEHEIIDRKIQKSKLAVKVGGTYVSVKKSTEKREKTTTRNKRIDITKLVADMKAKGITIDIINAIMQTQNMNKTTTETVIASNEVKDVN